MKNVTNSARSILKKLFVFCMLMMTCVCSFAQDAKHVVWDYDGILPYIGYVIFGIIVLSIGFVSIKNWLDNRHDHQLPNHQ